MLYAFVLITLLGFLDSPIGSDAQRSDSKGSHPRKDNDGKSIIVAYIKNRMNEKEILRSMKKLESECGCNVRHLPHVGAFILTYRRGMTVTAAQLHLNSPFMHFCSPNQTAIQNCNILVQIIYYLVVYNYRMPHR